MIQSDNLYDLTADVSGSSLYDLTDKDGNRSLYISNSSSEDSSFQVHRDQAHSWLFKEVGVTCQDFEEICFYAGLEPSVVRKFTSNIINSEDVNNVRRSIHALL